MGRRRCVLATGAFPRHNGDDHRALALRNRMSITFARHEDRSHLPDPIPFYATTVKGRVLCKVFVATLHEADGDEKAHETARELWNRYIDMVEKAAAQKILAGKFEADGTIVVRDADLEAMRRDSA
jgi:hypothetical protein